MSNSMSSDFWRDMSEALAFVGNSLLAPMSQTGDVTLNPSFWDRFPCFGDDGVKDAVNEFKEWSLEVQKVSEVSESPDPVQVASYEYAKLFMGPPSPYAAPWETFYTEGSGGYGFGRPTFEMRELLRQSGIKLSNPNNQYEDHIGIELLYMSVLCSKMEELVQGVVEESAVDVLDLPPDPRISDLSRDMRDFAHNHPLSWIGSLRGKVDECFPGGYISHLTNLANALLVCASR